MRGRRRLVWLALAVGFGLAGLHAGGVSSASGPCVVSLRVDVGGSGQRHWALGGALNTGRSATLRAVARGCAHLTHIGGRWVDGRSGLIRHPCAGKVCDWAVRSQTMSAAVFQAYAESLEGARKYSNVVRVAWAGPTLNRLTGMYTTYVRGTETRGTAHIELSGNRITVTNEHNVTATGTYSSATRKITLTRGDWPDATPTHPFIGRVSVIEGRVRIDWCCTVDGNKSGGYWVRE